MPCFVVFDGDADYERQARARDQSEEKIAQAVANHKRENRRIVGYLGGASEDYPATKVHERYAVAQDGLETYLRAEWPEWEDARQRLINEERGLDGKHEDTYRQAAIEAETGPPAWLSDIVNRVMDMCTDG